MKKKKVGKKVIMAGRQEALKNALDKGYITQEEYDKSMKKPYKEKKKKVKNPRAVIFGGLNTNSM
jgi:membrane carboxypeptidase/penicillin-binding protein